MNPNLQLSNKTKTYLLRMLLSGLLALTIGMAGAGGTLQAAAEGLAQGETGNPLVGDMRIAPDLGIVSAQSASGSNAPDYYDTSVFMTGSVAVGVILPESSDGTESWTPAKVNNVKSEIQAGMDWWSTRYAENGVGNGSLSFTYDWHTPYDGTESVAVSSEPINNSSVQDYIWANEILENWGYTESYTGSGTPDVDGLYTMYLRSLAYVNDLRTQKGTDWAFVIFVADSEIDSDGKFIDGYFAYAYLYGPMMVMTYDNANWGIGNMDRVAAHETGHIFGAGDQYYQAGYGGCPSKTQKYGYLGIPNSNCDNPTTTSIPSIMKSNTMVLDSTARDQVGWRDSDSDGVFDPLDTPPSFNLNNYTPNPTTNTNLAYSGTTYIQPWPHAVCSGSDRCYTRDISTQKLTVDYSVDGGAWQSAGALDGAFSSDYEGFNFTTGTLLSGTHDISVRSHTSQGSVVSTWPDSVTIQPLTSFVSEVDNFPGLTIEDVDIPFTDVVDTTSATTDRSALGDGFIDPTIIYGIGDCNSNVGDNSVWYNYTPETNINLYVDTNGSTESYDTLLAVWKGEDITDLTLVACNDDISSFEPFIKQSKVGFFAEAGVTYYIEVIDYAGPGVGTLDGPGGILNFHMEEGDFSLVDVYLKNNPMGSYFVPSGGQAVPYYDGGFDGPVHVVSTNDQNFFVSERQIYGNSFTESLGIPDNQLTTDYWLPFYDSLTMRTWISIGAPDTNSASAIVDVYIGGTKMNINPYVVPIGGQAVPYYGGVSAGPVHVVSTNGQKIFVSERIIYGNSFTETMGIPSNQLTTDYWFPWYDWLTMSTWISISAPDTNSATATVDVYIGTKKMNASPYQVPVGGQIMPYYPGEFSGPVRVVSTNGQNIFVSERQIYGGSSFTETVGIPNNQLTTDYWFPWYDAWTMKTWISIGAPTTNSTPAMVDVYIGGIKMNASPYQVPAGGQAVPYYSGAFDGPVRVVSANGQKIFVTERQIYGNSFTETPGIPDNQLTTDYWFPWYDAWTMKTWISIGAP